MPTKSKRSRVSVINAVQTPLGFFTLGVLVVEVLIGIVAAGLSEPARAYLGGGMLLLLFMLIGIVAYLAYDRPEVLRGEASAPAAPVAIKEKPAVPRGSEWLPVMLHHVSLSVTDLERSKEFYKNVMGLTPLPRPDVGYQINGAWLELPGTGQQLHLIENKNGTFRRNPEFEVYNDCHFALRVSDVDTAFKRLESPGRFLDSHPYVERKRYPHFYTLDPDGHVIEINGSPKTESS